jgi:hypothetical protein
MTLFQVFVFIFIFFGVKGPPQVPTLDSRGLICEVRVVPVGDGPLGYSLFSFCCVEGSLQVPTLDSRGLICEVRVVPVGDGPLGCSFCFSFFLFLLRDRLGYRLWILALSTAKSEWFPSAMAR